MSCIVSDEIYKSNTIPVTVNADSDLDGIIYVICDCPSIANPRQEDLDNDNISEVCDGCCFFLRGYVGGGNLDQIYISDLVLLTEFMFQGGAAPASCI